MLTTLLQYLGIIVLVNANIELIIMPDEAVAVRDIDSNFMLTCQVNNAPGTAKLAWFNNLGNEITKIQSHDPVITLDDEDNKLFLLFHGLQEHHKGSYTCKLIKDGKVLSELARKVQPRIKFGFARAPPKQFLPLGMEGLIACEPNPGLTVKKFIVKIHSGTQIDSQIGGRAFETRPEGFLVKRVELSDAGLYTCLMREGVELFTAVDIQVDVESIPVMTDTKSYHLGIEGGNLSITCEAEGDNIRYKFFINGNQLVNDSRVNVDSITGKVFFSNLIRTDKGQFTCSAENGVGRVNSTRTLVVQTPPLILSFLNVTIKEGEPGSIECVFEGLPTPFITISKIGTPVSVHEKNKINFNKATIDDVGLYLCEINSILGNDSRKAMVHIKLPPRASPSQIYHWFSFALHTKNITCSVIAYPRPTFLWFFNDVLLQIDNVTFTRFNGEYESHLQIYIAVRDQYWIYAGGFREPAKITCSVNNSEGAINISMTFARSTAPDMLYNLTYDVYPCQINFNYTLPEDTGDEPIIGLVAYVNDTTRNLPLTHVLKIKLLQPQTTYIIRVACRNIAGTGDAVDEFVITTLSPSAPYPVNITSVVYSINNRSARVFWDEPIDVCLPIINYKINFREVTLDWIMHILSFSDWITIHEKNGSALSTELKHLQENSNYQLEAFIKNEMGESKFVGRFIFKTIEKKDALSGEGNLFCGLLLIVTVLSASLF